MKKWFLPRGHNKKTALKNARIIDPETNFDQLGDLITEDGIIKDFGSNILAPNFDQYFEKVIECNNNIVMPGIIDMHVHLRDPGQTHKEDIQSGTKAAVAGGVTTVVCQPNTTPPIDSVETLNYINKKAAESSYARVFCYASVTHNGKTLTDMHALKKAGALGFTDDGMPVMNPLLMQKAFGIASDLNLLVAQHAEDLFLSDGGCINQGLVSSDLNVPGIPNIAESVMVARDIILIGSTKAHYHVLHVSTKESVKAVEEAKKRGLNVTCEVTPHHLLLNEEEVRGYNTLAKMNPPLRTEEDRLYMIEALKNGTIDTIASDHAPHEESSKNMPITDAAFGIIGLETMLPLSLELYHSGKMDLHSLLAKLTCNPAKILKLNSGRIKVGAPADLTVLDIEEEWVIDLDDSSSRSKNSPFGNKKVKGRVKNTFVGGKEVFKH